MDEVVTIPYSPRSQFQPYHDRQKRWAAIVAHRRCGKTVATVNDLIKAALLNTLPEPRYAYIAPYYIQAKDIAWNYLKRYTAPLLEYGGQVNESELAVTLPTGARIRLYGAENGERIRGTYLDGVVLDEYGDFPPNLWQEVIRPALSDRQGGATFIGTPKGHNQFYEVCEQAKNSEDWFFAELKAGETGILPATELAAARKDMTQEQYEQEYECSFEAAIRGAYFGKEMRQAEQDGRISGVPYDKAAEVVTAWDLGIGDSTAIWFAQAIGREIHVIDYYESSGVGLDHYVGVLRQRGYLYGDNILPHDVEARELGTGKTRKETLEALGLRNIRIAPKVSLEDGISAARLFISKCWIDRAKCEYGIEALKQYRTEYDEKRKVFSNRPLHDWTSHAADAWRYLALGFRAGPAKWDKIKYPSNGAI